MRKLARLPLHILSFIAIAVFLSACAQEKTPPSINNTQGQNQLNAGVADCSLQFKQSKICVSYQWEKVPTETENGSFTFKTYRANALDQSPVLTALDPIPYVLIWMPSMGHGSSLTTVDVLDTGTYRVSNVFFIMPGNWEIHFQLKLGETVEDEAVVPYTF